MFPYIAGQPYPQNRRLGCLQMMHVLPTSKTPDRRAPLWRSGQEPFGRLAHPI
jgi:hypothetical protein